MLNNAIYATQAGSPVASSIADEVLNSASMLASRARSLSERVDEKLDRVMIQAIEQDGHCGESGQKMYPPLFNQLRENFNSIQASLSSIEDAISRTEL